MTMHICPACDGEGVRLYQPHTRPSPDDVEVECDLCRNQGLPGARRVITGWEYRRWKRRPTLPKRPTPARRRR